MMRVSRLTAAYALDWVAGDPEWMPHPVRMIGWGVHAAEQTVRLRGAGRNYDLAAGSLIAISVPAIAYFSLRTLLEWANRRNRILGGFSEVFLTSSCLATRNLLDEARKVLFALDAGQIIQSRVQLARIVGRDTVALDESEICRALIETLAESLCDGIVAPLFYLALGGAPLAMAYKAVNTMDSMVGHRDQQYLYYGRAAARLDDLANWIPARISATLVCIVALWMSNTSGRRAASIWLRDGHLHASPNAGQSESAMAGALAVRLGGENNYAGERVPTPHMGREFQRPDRAAAGRALQIVAMASLLGFAAALFLQRRNGNG